MIRGLTTAVSGMVADERVMQLLSNNLANLQTPGFLSSDAVLRAFPEQFLEKVTGAGRQTAAIGPVSTGVVFQEGAPVFTEGPVQQTGRSLDVAIIDAAGKPSFFAVQYQPLKGTAGIALTRDGHFSVNAAHELTDNNGNLILPVDAAGRPVPGDRIVLNPNYQGTQWFGSSGAPVVDGRGNLSYQVVNSAGRVVPGLRLGTVDTNTAGLGPLGRGEYIVGTSLNPQSVLAQLTPGAATLAPGELQQSNVNETQTLTQMLPVVQQYQANQQALQNTIQTLSTAVTDIGKVQI